MSVICDCVLEFERGVWRFKKIKDFIYKRWVDKEDIGMKIGKEWLER